VKPLKPLQEQHSKSNPKIILKNDENIANKLTINTYKYESIANRPARKPYTT
jgi:glutamate formiminotransferase